MCVRLVGQVCFECGCNVSYVMLNRQRDAWISCQISQPTWLTTCTGNSKVYCESALLITHVLSCFRSLSSLHAGGEDGLQAQSWQNPERQQPRPPLFKSAHGYSTLFIIRWHAFYKLFIFKLLFDCTSTSMCCHVISCKLQLFPTLASGVPKKIFCHPIGRLWRRIKLSSLPNICVA